jgi:hypothetical protein
LKALTAAVSLFSVRAAEKLSAASFGGAQHNKPDSLARSRRRRGRPIGSAN